jgi:hypothetical protein
LTDCQRETSGIEKRDVSSRLPRPAGASSAFSDLHKFGPTTLLHNSNHIALCVTPAQKKSIFASILYALVHMHVSTSGSSDDNNHTCTTRRIGVACGKQDSPPSLIRSNPETIQLDFDLWTTQAIFQPTVSYSLPISNPLTNNPHNSPHSTLRFLLLLPLINSSEYNHVNSGSFCSLSLFRLAFSPIHCTLSLIQRIPTFGPHQGTSEETGFMLLMGSTARSQ